jgi:hypothetical protein
MPLLCDRTRQVVVAGRVGGSQAWQYLERETACRVRLFAEERGLATAPPGYHARSVLGFLIEEIGCERFFQRLAELGDGAVIDTRVIEAHMGVEPGREDRFQSDLLAWEAIEEPFLRRFTKAASEAPIPILLGGHSLPRALTPLRLAVRLRFACAGLHGREHGLGVGRSRFSSRSGRYTSSSFAKCTRTRV